MQFTYYIYAHKHIQLGSHELHQFLQCTVYARCYLGVTAAQDAHMHTDNTDSMPVNPILMAT